MIYFDNGYYDDNGHYVLELSEKTPYQALGLMLSCRNYSNYDIRSIINTIGNSDHKEALLTYFFTPIETGEQSLKSFIRGKLKVMHSQVYDFGWSENRILKGEEAIAKNKELTKQYIRELLVDFIAPIYEDEAGLNYKKTIKRELDEQVTKYIKEYKTRP